MFNVKVGLDQELAMPTVSTTHEVITYTWPCVLDVYLTKKFICNCVHDEAFCFFYGRSLQSQHSVTVSIDSESLKFITPPWC